MIKISPFTPLFFNGSTDEFGSESRYMQLFSSRDTIVIEVITTGLEHVSGNIINAVTDSNVVMDFTEVAAEGAKFFYARITGLAEGCYYADVCGFKSDIFRIVGDGELEGTTLIQYTSANNNLRSDVLFNNGADNIVFDFRVHGGFKDDDWAFSVNNEQFELGDGNIVELFAVESTQKTFTLGTASGCPIWFGEHLNRILCCGEIHFNGLRYVRKGNSAPEVMKVNEGVKSYVFRVQLQGMVENIDVQLPSEGGGETSGGGVGYVYLIKLNDTTQPTDANTFSALRTMLEIQKAVGAAMKDFDSDKYLRKDKDDTANGLIKFIKGVNIGNFIAGMIGGSGAAIDGEGNAELNSLVVREGAVIPEITFNCIDVVSGEMAESFSFGTIKDVDTVERVVSLDLLSGQVGTPDVGDFNRGTFHNVTGGNMARDEEDTNGFYSYAGFSTSYFKPVEILVNEPGEFVFRYDLQPGTVTHPIRGMKFYAYGNEDPLKTDRHCITYHNRKYTRRIEGVTDWKIKMSNIKMQSGYLDGLTHNGMALHGWGLYSENNYFTGTFMQLSEQQKDELAPYLVDLSVGSTIARADSNGNIAEAISTTISVTKGSARLTQGETPDKGLYTISMQTKGCSATASGGVITLSDIVSDGYVDATINCEGAYSVVKRFSFARLTEAKPAVTTEIYRLFSYSTIIRKGDNGVNNPSEVRVAIIKTVGKDVIKYQSKVPWPYELDYNIDGGREVKMTDMSKGIDVSGATDNLSLVLYKITDAGYYIANDIIDIPVIGASSGSEGGGGVDPSNPTVVYTMFTSVDTIKANAQGNHPNTIDVTVVKAEGDNFSVYDKTLPSGLVVKMSKDAGPFVPTELKGIDVSTVDDSVRFQLVKNGTVIYAASVGVLSDIEAGGVVQPGKDAVGYDMILSENNLKMDSNGKLNVNVIKLTIVETIGDKSTEYKTSLPSNSRIDAYIDGVQKSFSMANGLDVSKARHNVKLKFFHDNICRDSEIIYVLSDGSKGDNGEPAIVVDLTNDISSVSCDADGNVVGALPTTKVQLFAGTEQLALKDKPQLTLQQGIQATSAISGEIRVTGIAQSVPAVSEIGVRVTDASGKYTRSCIYSIVKNIPGRDGEIPTTYQLNTSVNVIKVDKGGNHLTKVIKAGIIKNDKGVITELNAIPYGYAITVKIDGVLVIDGVKKVIDLVNGVDVSQAKDEVVITLLKDGKVWDSETIPVIYDGKDGPDGESSVAINLTNDNASVASTNDGTVDPSSLPVGTAVEMYHGLKKVSLNSVPVLSHGYGNKITAKAYGNGSITISAISKDAPDVMNIDITGEILVDGASVKREATFTITKSKEGVKGDQGDKGDSGHTYIDIYKVSNVRPITPVYASDAELSDGWSMMIPQKIKEPVSFTHLSTTGWKKVGDFYRCPKVGNNEMKDDILYFDFKEETYVDIELRVNTEGSGYDFGFVGALDKRYSSRPSPSDALLFLSGTNRSGHVSVRVPAGNHTIQVLFSKDSANSLTGEYVEYRILQLKRIWTSRSESVYDEKKTQWNFLGFDAPRLYNVESGEEKIYLLRSAKAVMKAPYSDPDVDLYIPRLTDELWNETKQYAADYEVMDDDSFYVSLKPSKGIPTSNKEYWKDIPGWSSALSDVTEEMKYQYICVRQQTNTSWGPWSAPVLFNAFSEKGEQGLDGSGYIKLPWAPGIEFLNGKTLVEGAYITHIAMVKNRAVASGWDAYLCLVSHTSSNSFQEDFDKGYWKKFAQNVSELFAQLIVAQNAIIDFMSGNQLLIRKDNGDVTLGLSGSEAGNKIRLWAGAQLPDNAPFRVDEMGQLVAENAKVKGDITVGAMKMKVAPFSDDYVQLDNYSCVVGGSYYILPALSAGACTEVRVMLSAPYSRSIQSIEFRMPSKSNCVRIPVNEMVDGQPSGQIIDFAQHENISGFYIAYSGGVFSASIFGYSDVNGVQTWGITYQGCIDSRAFQVIK